MEIAPETHCSMTGFIEKHVSTHNKGMWAPYEHLTMSNIQY